MLDTIADFWKPVKKFPSLGKVKPEELQIGSAIVFGFVPQTTLSGKRLVVSAVNSYRFAEDTLTSFVLTQEKDAGASMIIAEADGEKYLAISRRMSMNDRGKLFNQDELEAVISQADVTKISSKEGITDYKGWVVNHYKREIQGMKGTFFKGDYRKAMLPEAHEGQAFAYTLLVSDSNEHALEIEKYNDGRIEVYATVYRRLSDIGEITHPTSSASAKEKIIDSASAEEIVLPFKSNTPAAPVFSSKEEVIVLDKKAAPRFDVSMAEPATYSFQAKPEPKFEKISEPTFEVPTPPKAELKVEQPKAEEPKIEVKHDVVEHVKTEPVKLPEFPAAAVAKKEVEDVAQAAAVITQTEATALPQTSAPITIQASSQPFTTQEIKAVNKDQTTNFVNESIDCDLPVANKIIDEAIRQEMRINDVVRRVIGLPVSAQESVQIPVTLTDQDYSLLAIRYGINTADREAIKKRIIEDLNDFSGVNKARKAA